MDRYYREASQIELCQADPDSKVCSGAVIAFVMTRSGIYLHHRDSHAPRSPNMLSGFGGGIEGRDVSPNHAILREIREEIKDYSPPNLRFIGMLAQAYRTDEGANGPLFVYCVNDLTGDVLDKTITEGSGGIVVPYAGIQDWREPPIVPDAHKLLVWLMDQRAIA